MQHYLHVRDAAYEPGNAKMIHTQLERARSAVCMRVVVQMPQASTFVVYSHSVAFLTRCLAAGTVNLGVARKSGRNLIQQEMERKQQEVLPGLETRFWGVRNG